MNNETEPRKTSSGQPQQQQQFVCQQILPQPFQRFSSIQLNSSPVYMHSHGLNVNSYEYNHFHHTHANSDMGHFVSLAPPPTQIVPPMQTFPPSYVNYFSNTSSNNSSSMLTSNSLTPCMTQSAATVVQSPLTSQTNIPPTVQENKASVSAPELSTEDSKSVSPAQSVFTSTDAVGNLQQSQPQQQQMLPSTDNVNSPSTSINSSSQIITPLTHPALVPPTTSTTRSTLTSTTIPQCINNNNLHYSNTPQPMMWHCHPISTAPPPLQNNLLQTQSHQVNVSLSQTALLPQENVQQATQIPLTNINTTPITHHESTRPITIPPSSSSSSSVVHTTSVDNNSSNTLNNVMNPIVYMPIPANALQQYYQTLFPFFNSSTSSGVNNNNNNNLVPTTSPRNVNNNNNNNNNYLSPPHASTTANINNATESKMNTSGNVYVTPNAVDTQSTTSVFASNTNNNVQSSAPVAPTIANFNNTNGVTWLNIPSVLPNINNNNNNTNNSFNNVINGQTSTPPSIISQATPMANSVTLTSAPQTHIKNEANTSASNNVANERKPQTHNAVPEEFTMLTLQPGTVLGDGIPFCPKGVIPLKQYARRLYE